jgi:predicted unusual protein kinase regulating ubiquinone biosynthesis (AarF/ABC1/UbiB family)
MVPKGAFIEKSVGAAKEELLTETNYFREAENQRTFRVNFEEFSLLPDIHSDHTQGGAPLLCP